MLEESAFICKWGTFLVRPKKQGNTKSALAAIQSVSVLPQPAYIVADHWQQASDSPHAVLQCKHSQKLCMEVARHVVMSAWSSNEFLCLVCLRIVVSGNKCLHRPAYVHTSSGKMQAIAI